MKVLILAGGFGTRLSEETTIKPKPMIEIGNYPIIWHIMKIYSHYGFNDFVILLGYKGYIIKEYFSNYFLHRNDIIIDLKNNTTEIINKESEKWKITLIDTGADTMTGGRILRAREYLNDEPFMLTYGDGVSDINLQELLTFHNENKKLATMTVIQPEGRFGSVEITENSQINKFVEKPDGDKNWINGGFFVCEPEILKYINKGDATYFEREPLENLAKDDQLMAFKHTGFWKCMDTLRDKNKLNQWWQSGSAPWKIW